MRQKKEETVKEQRLRMYQNFGRTTFALPERKKLNTLCSASVRFIDALEMSLILTKAAFI